MVITTLLMDFSLKEPWTISPERRKNIAGLFEHTLNKYIPELSLIHENISANELFIVYKGARSVHITIKGYEADFISCNIEFIIIENQDSLLSFEESERLGAELKKELNCFRSKIFPGIRRGTSYDIYLTTSDERIVEHDFEELLFEEKSEYQKVQIVRSKTLGNVLLLDDIQNLSENDIIYTETLMQKGKENYEGKEIVILGGGDGALLSKLLEEKPKFVTVLELDEVVIRACQKFMRSCCGNTLDKKKAENYEIIIGDCVRSLKKLIETGKKVDYVFGDLTDTPVLTEIDNKNHDQFLQIMLHLSFAILKRNGKYMTHVNGIVCEKALRAFEEMINLMPFALKYTSSTAFVPSFMENWVFYQISLAE